MGGVSFRAVSPAPGPAPIFYTEEFIRAHVTQPAVPEVPVPPVPEPQSSPSPVSHDELKAAERMRILAELRAEELSAAEAAAQRIGSWAKTLQSRTVPCLPEQAEVERCYASPPGGDQLRCGPAVDAFVKCSF
eukprot:TRINITY_DN21102_c1_g1_i1.p1 TRINITY_DN21102_c1_g1~~TRINITY_DN21102_c1_g1_i1.p1  ORF type:complete len:133 (-),score=25.41 TRINITY_DN21102_c1_g1_i1:231-629(-)